MQVQKSIEVFLEKNNLHKTLEIFKNQHKSSVHYATNKAAHLQNLHKLTLNHSNQSEVRQHYQKTDQKVLKRVVNKIKKQLNIYPKKIDFERLTKLGFFQKMVEKQNHEFHEKTSQADIDSSRSRFTNPLLEQSRQYQNQWEGENDVGYDLYECPVSDLERVCAQLSKMKNYSNNAIKSVQYPEEYYKKLEQKIAKTNKNLQDNMRSRLPSKVKFSHDKEEQIYPVQDGEVTYDSYNLKVIYDREKTGFEQERQLTIVINQVLAGRYQVINLLGQAQFSKAIQAKDLITNKNYCIKIIQNNKDYFDQSIDEIKLLRYISANCNTDQCHLLTLHDYFYHKEHLMLVTELLKDNLYDAYRLHPKHFDLKTIQVYTRQILIALQKMHSLHIIHTDLKPENILVKSYSNRAVKVIDVGSSIFFHDRLSFYIQTRCYRAPEVILGCKYDDKIDIWSLGCIIAEIFTKQVLFDSQSILGLLAKIQGLRGPWPSWMIETGKNVEKFFTKEMILFEEVEEESGGGRRYSEKSIMKKVSQHNVRIYTPKMTNLKARLHCENKLFIDFLSKCLKIDPSVRFSAKEALKHPFLNEQIAQ